MDGGRFIVDRGGDWALRSHVWASPGSTAGQGRPACAVTVVGPRRLDLRLWHGVRGCGSTNDSAWGGTRRRRGHLQDRRDLPRVPSNGRYNSHLQARVEDAGGRSATAAGGQARQLRPRWLTILA